MRFFEFSEDGVGGDTGASVADLAGMFKLDLATVEAIVATVAAPTVR